MMRLSILLMLISVSTTVVAQTTIRTGSEVKVKGIISTRGSVTNTSDKTNMSEASLMLTGTNQTINTIVPLSIQEITIDGGGSKTVVGDWTITGLLTLTNGLLVPTGKIYYTGSTLLSGSPDSFISGMLFQPTGGIKRYPIGDGNVYMPMSLNNVQSAQPFLGVKAFSATPGFSLPPDISTIGNRYWQVDGSFTAASASLYITGSSVDAAQKVVVVQADTPGAAATNSGGGVTGDFITSFGEISKPTLAIGVSEDFEIRVHDLITPHNADNINDKLKIVNIEYVASNTVTLVDRWGVTIKKWTNFSNYDDPQNPNPDGFDFTNLSPGNYICLVEYQVTSGGPKQKISQMVTVLKGN